MTKPIDDLLIARFTVGFPEDDAQVLRSLARKRRISIADLIRATTLRELDAILPETCRVREVSEKRRSK